jgi:hypothetical protein
MPFAFFRGKFSLSVLSFHPAREPKLSSVTRQTICFGDSTCAGLPPRKSAIRLVSSRPATEVEINQGAGLVEEIRSKDGLEPGLALKYSCLMALNLNEMVYLD